MSKPRIRTHAEYRASRMRGPLQDKACAYPFQQTQESVFIGRKHDLPEIKQRL